ncbi:Alcohol dehydrogenase superfamily zinc-type [Penicillium angulare]|uniref:Alcohol dehydrogenase superfamily zinc-type n=1 Tax=Penicillium angulare TaxID=116970 RepID=A0A9W9FB44_9EURO|nr:Alcohol dehydrogenase superfamily zinc-type [Penicillium angulare]
MSNKQILYNKTPTPSIDPALNTGTFRLNTTPIPQDVPSDKLLVRTHYLSLDPAMRQWLTAKRSYIAPVAPKRNNARPKHCPDPQIGEWVVAGTGWQEYAILGAKEVEKVTLPPGGRPTDAMSVLGMTGLTAYFGMVEVGKPKSGDTVVVSGAAGATGSIAGQIAKIKGAKRVIGLAGSEEKCQFLVKELGFDAAVNYKDAQWKKKLKEVTPEYIDVFFDNTGGEILDACLARAARDSRFVICGAISQYNAAKPQGPTSFMQVIAQRVTIKGFIVFDFVKQYRSALQELASWLVEGKLKRKEHIVLGGLEGAPQGLVDLYAGANTGKMMVEVAPMSEALGPKSKL